jgi:hypothetical protein
MGKNNGERQGNKRNRGENMKRERRRRRKGMNAEG